MIKSQYIKNFLDKKNTGFKTNKLCKHSTELRLKQIDKGIDIKFKYNWTNMFVFEFSVLNAL